MISYFVSYAMSNGFGCTEIQLRLPVRSLADVAILADLVSREIREPAVILNFQRFERATPERSAI